MNLLVAAAALLLIAGMLLLGYRPSCFVQQPRPPGSFVLQPFENFGYLQRSLPKSPHEAQSERSKLPTVFVPGMGDSCFNPGFLQITDLVSKRMGTKSICIGPGFDSVSDAMNSFAKTMNEQVENFHKQVQKHAELQHGFNAIGLSQGNLVIRAYVQRYNNPPVVNFLSIHGPHAGVSSLPRCDPHGITGVMCTLIASLIDSVVYMPSVQAALAQSNYFRDPMHLPDFLHKCEFLPEFLDLATEEHKSRLTKLNRMVLIMALRDTMIFPRESEVFGAFAENSLQVIVPAEKQVWYETLGLKQLLKDGKLITRTTSGNHLQFSIKELNEWLDTYFI